MVVRSHTVAVATAAASVPVTPLTNWCRCGCEPRQGFSFELILSVILFVLCSSVDVLKQRVFDKTV